MPRPDSLTLEGAVTDMARGTPPTPTPTPTPMTEEPVEGGMWNAPAVMLPALRPRGNEEMGPLVRDSVVTPPTPTPPWTLAPLPTRYPGPGMEVVDTVRMLDPCVEERYAGNESPDRLSGLLCCCCCCCSCCCGTREDAR